ncbi:MAG: ABC transporter ATP-binding protein [Candidatus Competibacteraceae bacterium]|nr:MAG: ABC transporter ATP-binding protein [Candidatus Competibacteraceae bacterium]
MHEPALSLHQAGVSYWRRAGWLRGEPYWALRDVSFTLYRGESLGVIGRNGAGKSTLLHLLAGILSPDRGRLINHGVRPTLLSLQIGFLPYLTGRQNAVLSGILLGLSRREVERQLDEIQAFSELGEFFDQPINTYSSGMRARLGFAVAIRLEADVLLIDEVLAVGDAGFRKKSTEVLKDRIRSDKTVVIVSHNTGMLRQLCDRVVWIEDGVSCMEGPVGEVLEAYERHSPTEGRLRTPVK